VLWLTTPAFEDEELRRKARLVLSIIRVVLVAVGLATPLSVLEPKNDFSVTVAVYGPVVLVTFGAAYAVQRGRVVGAAWVMAVMYWGAVALSVWFLGGLAWQNGTAFAVAVMMGGAVIGSRVALIFAVLSVAVAGVATVAQMNGSLPAPVTPMTPINAWIALTVTLALVSLMLHQSLQSLQAALEQARLHARERDEVRQKLLQTQKMEVVGRLSSGIAHDFNNLLTVIVGTTELLRTSELSKEDLELVEQLAQAAERAGLMTGQLLSFGRAHHDVAPKRVDLAVLLPRFVPLVSRLVSDTIEVDVEVDPGPLWVCATRVGLEQILLNLAVNARDAMPAGGRIEIRCRAVDDHVHLEVEDDGAGMSEAVRARLFEPFFTTKDKGTGLGLATVRDIAERFSADIAVRSRPGQGSTFTVRFPQAEEGLEDSAGFDLPVEQPARRVLLVEDQAAVQRTLSALLGSLGHEVTCVGDGQAALVALDAAPYDLVVTDVSMPGLGGFELASTLASRSGPPPVVFVSGNASADECPPYPAPTRLVAKPVTRAQLSRAVAACLEP